MLEPGSVFTSPRGTRVELLQTSPERLSLRRTLPRQTGGEGRPHRHMTGSETFEVLEGEAEYSLNGQTRVLSAGNVLEVAPGTTHVNPYTTARQTATLVQTVVPHPLSVEIYFASWLTWLAQGKADAHDEPTFLQMMAIAKGGGRGDTWGSGPPIFLQKLTAEVLGHVATLLGIRAVRVTRGG